MSGTVLLMPTCHWIFNCLVVVLGGEKKCPRLANKLHGCGSTCGLWRQAACIQILPLWFCCCVQSIVVHIEISSAVKWKAPFLWRWHQLMCVMSFAQHCPLSLLTITSIDWMILARPLRTSGLHFTHLQMGRRTPTSQGYCEA